MEGRRMPQEDRREQLLEAAFRVASREGIGGVTVRGVANEASVSHGLVLFYFKTKDGLLEELLDWLIESTAVLKISEDIRNFPRALDRLHALLHQEMGRLSHQPEQTRLFLEFWTLGAQNEGIRQRIIAELERYREAFRTIMEEVLRMEPDAFAGTTADGLAAVAVSWIHGCGLQAAVDPERFDIDEYLAAVRGLVGRLG